MKKKSIIMVFGILVSIVSLGQVHTLKAFYSGYEVDMKIYTFEDQNETYVDFTHVNNDVLKKFDLHAEKHVGSSFLITYTITGVGEKDSEDYYEELKITKLESIVLKKTVDEDEE
ncbi:MAG: hypothetical protein ACJA0Q_002238 [Saprospiraceae bacterium]|jgi:hypothetical protein|tara:strand:- start:875 stop:1219 length:345 start_codon:yes stop_codon:yes gene_type:complete